MKRISRRDFLKLSGLALSGLAFSPFLPESASFEAVEFVRVTTHWVSVYKEPDDRSPIVTSWPRDTVLPIYEVVNAGKPEYNPIWYRVFGGYMHRARLQRIRPSYNNKPLSEIPKTRLLGEVTVPYIQPYTYRKGEGWRPFWFRLYYSTIHWINDVVAGPDGKAWYQILDEADKTLYYYVPATHMRPIPPEEFAPISPEVTNKWIDVNLRKQELICYENEVEVRRAKISSGLRYVYDTPTGRFHIQSKHPSRRMNAADLAASDDENVLAGVPWCCFFTGEGHALHGTYWHDNFGMTMSHGCINLTNEDALWIFRWSRPVAAFEDIDPHSLDKRGFGTLIDIHY